MEGLQILEGFERMDFEQVTAMLSRAAWSPGIGIDEVRKGALHSELVVGAFLGERQLGYARVISDCTRFAYISDVYVHEDFRHRGIAKRLLEHLLGHPSMRDVNRWLLRSAANALYEQAGFGPLLEPEKWMEIYRPWSGKA